MITKHPKMQDIPALRALWKEAFGDTDAFLDDFFDTCFATKRCLCTMDGEKAAAMCYWLDCFREGKPIAYLYAVATAIPYRGEGLCRSLLDQARAILQEQGYAGILLVPGTPGLFAFYKKLGFTVCSFVGKFVEKAGKPLPLLRLTAKEYAACRKDLLPAGAAEHGLSALEFYGRQGMFYRGEGFLLACRVDKGQLFADELLGDAWAAPGIVAAFGLETGTFRTPGKDYPFAMYRSLDGSDAPGYFGIALD